jgi:hypothetical protein
MPNDPTPEIPLPTRPAAPPLAAALAAAAAVVVVVMDVVAVAIELAPADGDEEAPAEPTLTVTPTLPQSCCVKASTSTEPQKMLVYDTNSACSMFKASFLCQISFPLGSITFLPPPPPSQWPLRATPFHNRGEDGDEARTTRWMIDGWRDGEKVGRE